MTDEHPHQERRGRREVHEHVEVVQELDRSRDIERRALNGQLELADQRPLEPNDTLRVVHRHLDRVVRDQPSSPVDGEHRRCEGKLRQCRQHDRPPRRGTGASRIDQRNGHAEHDEERSVSPASRRRWNPVYPGRERRFVADARARVHPAPRAEHHATRSAIDGLTTRRHGRATSIRIRKRIEEPFGWIKTIAGDRQLRYRGAESQHPTRSWRWKQVEAGVFRQSEEPVGVIANLSLFFSIHTLFTDTRTHDWGPIHITGPVWSTISPRAVAVTVLAFVLVFRFQFGVLRVLGICAAAGAGINLATR
jgi:hypothetical protein